MLRTPTRRSLTASVPNAQYPSLSLSLSLSRTVRPSVLRYSSGGESAGKSAFRIIPAAVNLWFAGLWHCCFGDPEPPPSLSGYTLPWLRFTYTGVSIVVYPGLYMVIYGSWNRTFVIDAAHNSIHTVPAIISIQSQLSPYDNTHHSSRLIPRVDHLRERQNATDPGGYIGPSVPVGIGMVQLPDQLQFEPSVLNRLAPDLFNKTG